MKRAHPLRKSRDAVVVAAMDARNKDKSKAIVRPTVSARTNPAATSVLPAGRKANAANSAPVDHPSR
jgi:hypothetical protein